MAQDISKPVRATALNIYTLWSVFGSAVSVPNRVEPTSAAGLRRCMKAGLVVCVGGRNGTLDLTPAGVEAVREEGARREALAAKVRETYGAQPSGVRGGRPGDLGGGK